MGSPIRLLPLFPHGPPAPHFLQKQGHFRTSLDSLAHLDERINSSFLVACFILGLGIHVMAASRWEAGPQTGLPADESECTTASNTHPARFDVDRLTALASRVIREKDFANSFANARKSATSRYGGVSERGDGHAGGKVDGSESPCHD